MPKHANTNTNDDDIITTITVKVRNREWLKSLGRKGQTYVDILDAMRDLFERKDLSIA